MQCGLGVEAVTPYPRLGRGDVSHVAVRDVRPDLGQTRERCPEPFACVLASRGGATELDTSFVVVPGDHAGKGCGGVVGLDPKRPCSCLDSGADPQTQGVFRVTVA